MKKIKKVVKRICCGLIAVGCMLSSALPVLAGGGGTVRDLGKLAYSFNSYNGYADPKINGLSEIYFSSNNPQFIGQPILISNLSGFAPVFCVVNQNKNGTGDSTNVWVNQYHESYKKGQDTSISTNKKSVSSVKSCAAWFKELTVTNTSGSETIYQYLVKAGFSVTEMDKVLSAFDLCYFGALEPKLALFEPVTETSSVQNFKAENTKTIEDFYRYLKYCYDNNLKPWEYEDSSEDWTLPKFYLKTHNDNGLNKYTEYTLTWDTRDSFVENKESEYGFKVYIGTDNKPLNAKILDSTNLSPCLFTEKSFVFTWQDVKDLFSVLNTSKLENRFDIFIQVTHKDGSTIRALSNEYIHYLIVKRVEIRENNIVDKNGNEKSTYGKWENGQFKYTDGRDTSSEDNSTNSNGSSTAPGSNVSNDDYTDISNAPSSSQIDASATNSLIKTLDTIVSSVSNVPALLAKVYAWLPYQIITLIGTAIGLIVVVGIIKWVL